MDFKQLEYIIQIAETKNITKAAQKLFISQSALNQQLLNLEKELGIQLFYRSRANWHLTEAGEIYIRNARECLQIKHETYAQIMDLSNAKRGTLTIGLTPGRGIVMFTSIYPRLHSLYPNLTICPVEMNVRSQQFQIAQGNMDIGFMTLAPEQRTRDNYIILGSEEMLLAVPNVHPLSRFASPPGEPIAVMDIRELKHEPFVLMYPASTNRDICDRIFENAGFTPRILLETCSTSSIVAMVESRLCCAILPSYYVKGHAGKLAYFRLTSSYCWDLAVGYQKHSYLSLAARSFVQMASDYWKEHLGWGEHMA